MQSFNRLPNRLRRTSSLAFALLVCAATVAAEPGRETPAAAVAAAPLPWFSEAEPAATAVESIASDGQEGPIERLGNAVMEQIAGVIAATRQSRTAKELRFLQRGVASWYGRQFHGRRTASGERFDMYAMTAAHPSLPLSSYVRVRNVSNDRSIVVRVNDRGPFHPGRIIDLSFSAAQRLGLLGIGAVEVERVSEQELRNDSGRRDSYVAVEPETVRDASSPTAVSIKTILTAPAGRFEAELVARALAQADNWQQPVALLSESR